MFILNFYINITVDKQKVIELGNEYIKTQNNIRNLKSNYYGINDAKDRKALEDNSEYFLLLLSFKFNK